jgi:hypothetical protein
VVALGGVPQEAKDISHCGVRSIAAVGAHKAAEIEC